ncbi:hypothetical protein [Shumkonia mesophila]|uniref:hypothetical protein n=1 Tax=Shumkonia mesophila TaxID=2838854 RepID=UPI002934A5C9|nr:hypothetical protein [Shumkonia mesophila]
MEIIDISTSVCDEVATVRVCARPRGAMECFELWYRFEGLDQPLDGVNEAAAAALVVPCMVEGEPLSMPGRVSPVFLANIAKAQSVLAGWYDDLHPVEVRCSGQDDAPPRPADGVICCFSAGVDSWYSLLKHEPRVTHLLFVRGFDIGLDNDVLWQATRDNAATVARRLGKRLITCETNLRDVCDKRRGGWGKTFVGDFWGERLHGAAIASVALLLRRTIGELIVPATHSYAQVKPWGSSPQLDPLWSDGYLEITHDGCEVDRVAKVRRLAASDIALATLRVCYGDTPDINCGRCEKCLRTLMALRLCGAVGRAKTFPRAVALSEIHALIVPPHVRHHYVALQEEARRVGDSEVVEATEIVLRERLSAAQTAARLRRALRGTVLGKIVRRAKRAWAAAAIPPLEPHRDGGAGGTTPSIG